MIGVMKFMYFSLEEMTVINIAVHQVAENFNAEIVSVRNDQLNKIMYVTVKSSAAGTGRWLHAFEGSVYAWVEVDKRLDDEARDIDIDLTDAEEIDIVLE